MFGADKTAELLTSKIVTNAVKATAGRDRLLPVRLDLSSDKERLLIEVWDADPRAAGPDRAGRRRTCPYHGGPDQGHSSSPVAAMPSTA